jgi:hypothetical protein
MGRLIPAGTASSSTGTCGFRRTSRRRRRRCRSRATTSSSWNATWSLRRAGRGARAADGGSARGLKKLEVRSQVRSGRREGRWLKPSPFLFVRQRAAQTDFAAVTTKHQAHEGRKKKKAHETHETINTLRGKNGLRGAARNVVCGARHTSAAQRLRADCNRCHATRAPPGHWCQSRRVSCLSP